MQGKVWKVSIYFARKGERDFLPEVYRNRTQADIAAYNINKWAPGMDARAEETEENAQ